MNQQPTVDEILATQRHLVEQGFHSRIVADEKIKQALKAHIEAIVREVIGEDSAEPSYGEHPVLKTKAEQRQRAQQVMEREYGNERN